MTNCLKFTVINPLGQSKELVLVFSQLDRLISADEDSSPFEHEYHHVLNPIS